MGFRDSCILEQPAESDFEALPGGCARNVVIADSVAANEKRG